MTYEEFINAYDKAMNAFYNSLDDSDISSDDVVEELNRCDTLNAIFDAVISCVEIKSEDD